MNIKDIILTTILLLGYQLGMAQNAREIAEKASEVIEFESSEMISTLKIYDDKGNVRTRQVANATRKFGTVTKTMVKFLAPADVKGTAILIFDNETKDDDMWIYMPALRKSRRIVSSEKSKSFMGSEFSNADMSKPNMSDFTYKIAGTETVDGKNCWKVEAECNTETVKANYGFAVKILWIEKSTHLALKTEYYDLKGKLLKTMTMNDFRKQPNGKYFAFSMAIFNVQNNRKSEISIDKFQLGSKLTESSFSVLAMEK